MVKSVKEKVQEVVDGGPKKMTDITVNFKNGFVGLYENTTGHQIGQSWVAIMQGGLTLLFKSEDIDTIKVNVKE